MVEAGYVSSAAGNSCCTRSVYLCEYSFEAEGGGTDGSESGAY